MSVQFTYHGGMCVEIVRSDGYRILIDPYLTENPLTEKRPEDFADVNLILVTHYAFDHYGDAPAIMQMEKAELLCGTDTYLHFCAAHPDLAKRAKKTIYGDCKTYGETMVRCIRAFHVSRGAIHETPVFGPPLGFVIQVEKGVSFYHTGDTCLFGDMKLLRELYHPEIMCVGISRIKAESSCEMTPREAAMAASWVGSQVVIPTHYVQGSPDLREFCRHMQSFAPDAAIKSKVGSTFSFTPAQVADI